MKKSLAVLPVLLFSLALFAGCGDDKKTEIPNPKKEPTTLVEYHHFCHDCGWIEHSENCCKEGAEKCDKCKLHKGSHGCCVGGHPVACKECGLTFDLDKHSEHVCKVTEACDKCGCQKGSAGCCVKMKPEEADPPKKEKKEPIEAP